MASMSGPFAFNSIIYNGFDDTADGIGNHLSLLDRLVFDDIEPAAKSLAAIRAAPAAWPCGRVSADHHLVEPQRFRGALFLDIARETWDPDDVRHQALRSAAHKRVYDAVTAIYLMWESDRLWDGYADLVASYDFCIVTSSLLDDFLAERGIDVVRLPHPYDFALDAAAAPTRRAGAPPRFGISAGLWPRKKVALLAEVFADTFADGEASLSIHTRSDLTHPDYRDEYLRIDSARQRCPAIELVAETLSRQAYLDWLRGLDAYCFVSAGEGYSVTPREALHLGLPVVLHDAHVHREFSHLPGVVAVPSAGTEPAQPNTGGFQRDIGRQWRVDRDALGRALRHCAAHLDTLRAQLAEGAAAVRALHDVGAIREQWTQVLNERYRHHAGQVRPLLQSVREYPLSLPEPAAIGLDSPGFRSATGQRLDGRIYCVPGQHAAGHCLYGPYLPVTAPRRITLGAELLLVGNVVPDWLGTVDIYDSQAARVLAMEHVIGAEVVDGRVHVALDAELAPGQCIEFRVYWSGEGVLCLASLHVHDREAPRVAAGDDR